MAPSSHTSVHPPAHPRLHIEPGSQCITQSSVHSPSHGVGPAHKSSQPPPSQIIAQG
jgi:hypothetical protein